MNTATFVRDDNGFRGTAKLWHLSSPVHFDHEYEEGEFKPTRATEYVITSAVHAMCSGPETYIFPADRDGEVLSWGELDGSFRGDLDHNRAIEGMGYMPVIP